MIGDSEEAREVSADSVPAMIERALGHHQKGELTAAERLYRAVLAREPAHFDALHMLGVVAMQSGHPEHAAKLIAEAVALRPGALAAHCNLAYVLSALGRHEDAIAVCDEAIALNPAHADAHINRGNALLALKRHRQALASYDQAIALKPDFAEIHSNRGLALNALGRHGEALATFDRAIALKPDFAPSHHNRANTLYALGRFGEALAGYDRAIALNPGYDEARLNRTNALNSLGRPTEALDHLDDIIARRPDRPEPLSNRAAALNVLKRYEEALASCDRAIALKSDYADAHNNRGNALAALKRHPEALAAYETAIALQPDDAEICNNLGNVLATFKRYDEALWHCDRAIALKPDHSKSYSNRGAVLTTLNRHADALTDFDTAIRLDPDNAGAYYSRANALMEQQRCVEALADYEKAQSLDPDLPFLPGARLFAQLKLCDWQGLEARIAEVTRAADSGKEITVPFLPLAISQAPATLRRLSEIYAKWTRPPPAAIAAPALHRQADKIRIGYFSADFFNHATAILMAELFELHDRTRFEVTAFSFGPDVEDEMVRRLRPAFDRFIDVRDRSDRDVAMLARDLEIDIAVDLKGHTKDARQNIFAHRAAPVQVNYLGYPGTMGADYIDYLIADRTLIPPSDREHYVEKIVYLPHCYQVNDSTRRIGEQTLTRAQAGLPEDAFVFCCFNNSFKLVPETFERWMRILARVENSVLWLLEDNPVAPVNLRKEAARRGIDPQRLVFAPRQTHAEHLARHRLADLFLDSLPYNAHTTTSDALWAGLPAVTQIGTAFAGRVAASLLSVVGLPDLIAETPQDYEALAVDLATQPERLAEIRRRLERNRLTTPLFDTAMFARHIEAAYVAMYERQRAGLAPDHIEVPAESGAGADAQAPLGEGNPQ